MNDLVMVRRALLSVSDKTGLVDFATALQKKFGVELISTGGTSKVLRDAGLTVKDVSDLTGFPEMMDGRVKTLHPKVHGGLLAVRDDPHHAKAMAEHGIQAIDLVVINLYPFEATIAKPGCTFEDAIENIDIGGPSMVRSAAKNHRYVTIVTDASDYATVVETMTQHYGATTVALRSKCAQKAFATTNKYDGAIAAYLAKHLGSERGDSETNTLSDQIDLKVTKKQSLRYGENPHQPAALYVGSKSTEPSVAFAEQLFGKELSYINLLDADAALNCVKEFATSAACIVKHATPCGVGTGATIDDAFARAYDSDPLAAFGGIVAVNHPIDLKTAQRITEGQKFLEVIVAPAFASDALELLKTRWKNVRLLSVGTMSKPTASQWASNASLAIQTITGGFLVQQRDVVGIVESEWKVVSKRQPTQTELDDLKLAWLAVKHVKSNAIMIAKAGATVGIGGGQVDRVGAAHIAIEKAGDRAKGAVAASDAFFPFPDGPELLLKAGVTAIVQPGGSQRDALTIEAVDKAGAAMIFTGRRHFRH
ncbi:MAG: bifunctional phosphoribosylaminoimidazolecarboxamide formyltransferase/IMP cyclohydrolase [Tepidisphaeraceae bacterium]